MQVESSRKLGKRLLLFSTPRSFDWMVYRRAGHRGIISKLRQDCKSWLEPTDLREYKSFLIGHLPIQTSGRASESCLYWTFLRLLISVTECFKNSKRERLGRERSFTKTSLYNCMSPPVNSGSWDVPSSAHPVDKPRLHPSWHFPVTSVGPEHYLLCVYT